VLAVYLVFLKPLERRATTPCCETVAHAFAEGPDCTMSRMATELLACRRIATSTAHIITPLGMQVKIAARDAFPDRCP